MCKFGNRVIVLSVFLLLSGCANTLSYPASTPVITLSTAYTIQAPSTAIVTVEESTLTPPFDPERAYPVTVSTEGSQMGAYPAPTFGPSPTHRPTITPTATLSPIEKRNALKEQWDQCMRNGEKLAGEFVKNLDLAGLQFMIGDSRWTINVDGSYTLLSCLPGPSFSPGNDRIALNFEKEFWILNLKTEEIQQISDETGTVPWSFAWSPEGRLVYYNKALHPEEYDYFPGEIWAFDTETGERRQITNSPDLMKRGISVWPKHPDWLVYNATTADSQAVPGYIGAIVLAKTDGTQEQILTEGAYFLFSPDGEKLVYPMDGKGLVFLEPGKEPERLSVSLFEFQNWNFLGGIYPSWSKSGKLLALGGVANNEMGEFTGIAVMDLSTKKGIFLHPFTPVGSGGSELDFSWSPNNIWLAANIRSGDQRDGLWIIRSDGKEEHHFGQLRSVFWSLDGSKLLCFGGTGDQQLLLLDLSTWESKPVVLPEGARITGWGQ